jgi:signal transduction histidine kinase/HAMP domain-containing protein
MADLLAQNPLYSNLAASTPNGEVFCSAIPSPETINCGDRPFFQEVLRTKDFVVSNYITMRIAGEPGIAVLYPALDETGQVQAVVFAGIDLAWLDKFAAEAHLAEGSALAVINSAGTVLTRYPDPGLWRGQEVSASLLQILLSRREGVVDAVGPDGIPRLYAFTEFCCPAQSRLYLLLGIPKSVAFADANRTLMVNLVTLGILTLLALAIAWGGARLLVLNPVQSILDVIKRYDHGDFSARTHLMPGRGEIGRVGHALDKMAETAEARKAERDQSEEELRRHSVRAEAMASIAARLNAEIELENILDIVCQETAHALDVPGTSVSLRDPNSPEFRLATCYGMPPDSCARLRLSSLVVLAPIREGHVAVITDTAAQPEISASPLFADLGIRTLVGSPMLHEGQLVGALFVFARGEARQFSEDEIEFLKTISNQAATAVVKARLYESLRREQQLSARLLQGTITAQEAERKRIARELHDETIQGLIGLILRLDAIGLESETRGQDTCLPVQAARSAAQDILEGVRRLIADLRPSLLDDLGLLPAIAWYAERLLEPLGIATDVECNVEQVRLPQVAETALFRIAQEAINNIAKHSSASNVHVGMWVSDGFAVMRIEDDGHGFTPGAVQGTGEEQTKGFGLRGMRERVSMLGGQFSLQSTPGQGTTLEVRIPLAGDNGNGQDSPIAG